MTELYIACLIAIVLLIWLKTDALIEWGCKFGLSKILKENEFYRFKMEQLLGPIQSSDITYPIFLKLKYNCFFTRLLSCPMCLSFWLSVIGCVSMCSLLSIPTVYILSLLIYGAIVKLVIKS